MSVGNQSSLLDLLIKGCYYLGHARTRFKDSQCLFAGAYTTGSKDHFPSRSSRRGRWRDLIDVVRR